MNRPATFGMRGLPIEFVGLVVMLAGDSAARTLCCTPTAATATSDALEILRAIDTAWSCVSLVGAIQLPIEWVITGIVMAPNAVSKTVPFPASRSRRLPADSPGADPGATYRLALRDAAHGAENAVRFWDGPSAWGRPPHHPAAKLSRQAVECQQRAGVQGGPLRRFPHSGDFGYAGSCGTISRRRYN